MKSLRLFNQLRRPVTNTGFMKTQARGFAALSENASDINLSSVNPADVHDSTTKGVGALVAALAKNQATESV